MKHDAAAKPYSKAAYSFAKAHHALPLWQNMLHKMANIVEIPEFDSLLRNPAHNRDILLNIAIEQLPVEDPYCRNFLFLLNEKRRLCLLPEIAALFDAEMKAEAGVRLVHIKSALPLSKESIHTLDTLLSARFKQSLELKITQDPSLIGGIVIESEDCVMDASLRGKIHRLQHDLTL